MQMRFVLNGSPQELATDQVEQKVARIQPEPVRTHGVWIAGIVFPVKQAVRGGDGDQSVGLHEPNRQAASCGVGLRGRRRYPRTPVGSRAGDGVPRPWRDVG